MEVDKSLEPSIVALQTQIFMLEQRREQLGRSCDDILKSMKQSLDSLKHKLNDPKEEEPEEGEQQQQGFPKTVIVERQKGARDAGWEMIWSYLQPQLKEQFQQVRMEGFEMLQEEVEAKEVGSVSRKLDTGVADLDKMVVVPLKHAVSWEFGNGSEVTNLRYNGKQVSLCSLLLLSRAFHLALHSMLTQRGERVKWWIGSIGWRNKAMATFYVDSEEGVFDYDVVLSVKSSDGALLMLDDGCRLERYKPDEDPKLIMNDHLRPALLMEQFEQRYSGARELIKRLKSMSKNGWMEKVEYNKAFKLPGVMWEEVVCHESLKSKWKDWEQLSEFEKLKSALKFLSNLIEEGKRLEPLNMPGINLLDFRKRPQTFQSTLSKWLRECDAMNDEHLERQIINQEKEEDLSSPGVVRPNNEIGLLKTRLDLLEQRLPDEITLEPHELAIVKMKLRYAKYKLDGLSNLDDSQIGEMLLGRSFVKLRIGKFDKEVEEAAIKGEREKVREEMEKRMISVEMENVWQEQEVKRILVQGEAGVGKSTLLKRIAQKWACEGMWRDQFDAVIHIALRNVKNRESLEDILLFGMFGGDEKTRTMVREFLKWGSEHKDKVLWLMDGWDEINPVEGSVLWEIQHAENEEVINFIGGSRPEATIHVKCDSLLQIQGFTQQGIQRYIKLYYGEWEPIESCLTLLLCLKQQSPKIYQQVCRKIVEPLLSAKVEPKPEAEAVREVLSTGGFLREACCIPLMLRLVCMIHPKGITGRTMIYEKLIDFVLDRAKKFLGEDKAEKTLVKVGNDLQKLAWEGFKAQNLLVTKKILLTHCSKTLGTIERCGLLKDEGLIGLEHSFVWMHYTFQEYLAAKYVCTMVPNNEVSQVLKDIRNRMGEKSNVFFLFVCGIGGNANDCMNEWLPEIEVDWLQECKELSWLSEGNKSLEHLLDKRMKDDVLFKFFTNACDFGHVGAVKYALGRGVDPSADNNMIIVRMSKYGHLEIVKLLLQDERVDASVDKNYAVGMALEYGHLEIVKLLLQDKRVNPSADDNYAVRIGSSYDHLESVELLVQDEKFDPSADNNFDIRFGSQNGDSKVVKLLLQDERVDPSANNNQSIQRAAQNGHLEIVKLLLQDQRVDPSAKNDYAIRLATKKGHLDVVKLLLQDRRVDSCYLPNDEYTEATSDLFAEDSKKVEDDGYLFSNTGVAKHESSYDNLPIIGRGKNFTVFKKDEKIAVRASKTIDALIGLRVEYDLLTLLNHKNILKCFRIDINGLQLEYCEGGSLDAYLMNKKVIAQPLHMIRQMIQGVSCIHSNLIIHNDLTTANVWIKQDTLKICGFGLSRRVDSKNERVRINQSFHVYSSSPEIVKERRFSMKSDVWKVGLIMYDVLSECSYLSEYKQMTTEGLFQHLQKGNIPKNRNEITPDMWEIMLLCWKYKEEERVSIQELNEHVIKIISS